MMPIEPTEPTVRETLELLDTNPQVRASTHFRSPASEHNIAAEFERWGVSVSNEVRQFYAHTNGLRFGKFEIASLDEMLLADRRLVTVHHWGTGDVDCLTIDGDEGGHSASEAIVFVGHDPPWRFEVSPTFGHWLRCVVLEFIEHGEICDPWDCRRLGLNRTYTPPPEMA